MMSSRRSPDGRRGPRAPLCAGLLASALAAACAPPGPCSEPSCPGPACAEAAWQQGGIDAALPGESTACSALGIAACAGLGGSPLIACYTATGELVDAVTGALPSETPCSDAQIRAWVEANDAACWRLLPFAELSDSPLKRLLEPERVPAKVCCSLDAHRCWFRTGCAEHVYDVWRPFGGNTHGARWTLTITPPDPVALRDGLPFIDCPSHRCGTIVRNGVGPVKGLFVTRTSTSLVLSFDDTAIPGPAPYDPAAVVAECRRTFTGCESAP